MLLKTAGPVLRKIREAKNLSLREVARQLHWSPGRLSKYENDQLSVSLDDIEAIAGVLGESSIKLVFECLKQRYPKMGRTEAGKLVAQLVSSIDDRPTSNKK